MKYLSILFALVLINACRNEPLKLADITARPAIMCTPPLSDADWYTSGSHAPLLAGMDILSYPISTKSPEAQKYFNQGLLLAYAFNHAEAARSFFEAARKDSTCAMCYWGYAYVLGPNYNAGMEPDNYQRAYGAIQKAIKLSAKSTPKEKALIKAMSARYVKDPVNDRRPLDSAYMLAVKEIHKQYPEDVDVAAMYAEALMDMHPWDLWDKKGNPKPWTPDILKAIEIAIKTNPKHPGGHHFYIHAVEASNAPERALASCKLFDDGLVPNAGHLVHMPSHIYIHTGDYHKGTVANIKAVQIDSDYVTQCHALGIYPVAYYPHNYHFLAACATMEGDSKWALEAAYKMAEQTNHKGMFEAPIVGLQHLNSIPYFVRVKFGKWQDILHEGPPDSKLVYPTGIYHYAKGMAYVGLKDYKNAKTELDALKMIAKEDTLKTITIWGFNSMFQILDIAQKVLEGELLAGESKFDESIRLLRTAVADEDQLLYQEPPDWFFSVRHYLGAVLLDAKKPEDAIMVYLEDLKNYPRNGWALNGLAEAYMVTRQTDKAKEIAAQFKEAWTNADVKLKTSLVE
jgi:tetratricopeptide (TPR) repeat protein